MGTFQLTAGTVVKHGTTASHLEAILAGGLTPNGQRNASRDLTEPKPMAATGVYCGLFTAYFGAYAAFAAYCRDVLSWPGHKPPREFYFDYPIVLTIRLGRDVEVLADEDFLPAIDPERNEDLLYTLPNMRKHARMCWNRHRSCVIPMIPAAWITEIEVLNMLAPISADGLAQERFICDLHVLACGVVQTQRLLSYERALELWQSRVATDLSGPSLSTKMVVNDERLRLLRSHPLGRAEHGKAAHEAVSVTFRELSRLSPEYGISARS